MTEGKQTEKSDREPRRPVRVGLTFEDFRSFITTYASNISMGGMFIRASNPLSPGTLCNLDVKLKDGFPLIRGLSEVAWVRERSEGPDRPPGMGVRFRDLEEKSRALIYEIVERRMADGGSNFEPPDLDELLESAEKRRERVVEDALPDFDLDDAPHEPEQPHPLRERPEETAPEVFDALPDLEDEDAYAEAPLEALPTEEEDPFAASPVMDAPIAPPQSPPAAESPATKGPAPALNLDDLFPPLPREEEPPPPPRILPERGAASSADDDEDERPVSPRRLAPALLVIAIGATLGVLWMSGTLPGWLGLVDDIGTIPTRPAPPPTVTTPSSPPGDDPAAPTGEEPAAVGDTAPPPPAPVPAPVPTQVSTQAPPPRAAASAPFTTVRDIRTQTAGSITRVTLVCDGTADLSRVDQSRLGGGTPRVLLRIRGVETPFSRSRIDVGSRQLERIRVGYHSGNELHVVLDLASDGARVAGTDAQDNLLIVTLEGE